MRSGSKLHRNSLWWIASFIAILAVAIVVIGTTGNSLRDAVSTLMPDQGVLRVMPLATNSATGSLSLVTRQAEQVNVQSALVSVRLMESSASSTHTDAVGTGFVWDTAGHVVVPAHLLGSIKRVSATLPDGSATRGRIIGADTATNIAVMRLDRVANENSPISHEQPAVRAGEPVSIVWNNPAGETVIESGTIAETGRLLPIGTMTSPLGEGYIAIPDVIRIMPAHEASPAMPGNALVVDTQGALVGMLLPYMDRNSAAYYAIPREMVDRIIGSLIATGQYQHPWLGLSVRTVTEERANTLNLSVTEGVQVMAVLPGSPAEQAGLKGSTTLVRMGDDITYTGGDIITTIDGKQIHTTDDLLRYLARHSSVGQNIAVGINRNGQNLTIHVQVGARPDTAILD